jgi:hypothetical protein
MYKWREHPIIIRHHNTILQHHSTAYLLKSYCHHVQIHEHRLPPRFSSPNLCCCRQS